MTETHRIDIGKGCYLRFMLDTSKPKDDITHNWSELSYDGAPDSWVPEIGAHWHAQHMEHMTVLSGRVKLTVAGKEIIASPGDGIIPIPAFTVHSFVFFKGAAAVLRETADPAGTYKQEFFADLMATGPLDSLSFLQVVRVFYDGDTFIALPGNLRVLDRAFTWTMGWIASWLVKGKTTAVTEEGKVIELGKGR